MLIDLFSYRQRALAAEGKLAYFERRCAELEDELVLTKRQLERVMALQPRRNVVPMNRPAPRAADGVTWPFIAPASAPNKNPTQE